MAEKKKSGWQEFREGFKGMGSNMITGVSNRIAGRPYSENNTSARELLFGGEPAASQPVEADSISVTKPTLNDVIEGKASSTAKPDIVVPGDLLGGSTAGQPDDIDIDTTVKFEDIKASDVLSNVGLREGEKSMQAEEDVKNEDSMKTIGNFFKSVRDSISDWNVSNALDTMRQAKEEIVAVGYNEDNHNILRLAFNEGQGLSDDFGDTALKRGKGNKQVFDALYQQYEAERDAISNSQYDEYSKTQMLNVAFDNFLDEVNKRKLLKVYEDDYYSDGLIYGALDDNAKAIGRRKDQFSQEQLNRLAKSKIKEKGIYEVTPAQLEAFLESYGYNTETAQRFSLTEPTDTTKVRYELEDEGLSTLKSIQTHQIIDPAMEQIKALEDEGIVSSITGNEILANSYGVIEKALSQMHMYLDEPLAYYRVVQSKDYGELTTGEKAILGYGDGIMQFMDDYTKALQRWLQESIASGVEDGELVHAAEMIDGMSVTEFFKNAIENSNIKAGGLELLATESAIDAMQHINNNINYLYWQGKGSKLRRGWTEAQRLLGPYGYTAGELFQLMGMGLVKGREAIKGDKIQSTADYDLADFTIGQMIATEYNLPWFLRLGGDRLFGNNEDFAKLLRTYGMQALENIPEFMGEYKAIKPFLGGTSKYATLSKGLQLERDASAARKLNAFSKIFNTTRNSVGTTARAGGVKNWINKMYDGVADKLFSPRRKAVFELGKNGINRIVRDQAIDAIASYYDTESYSTPSFLLSVGFTGLTEFLPSILKDPQLFKMIKNKVRGLDWTTGTGWRLLDAINSDEEILKRWKQIYGTDFNTYRLVASNGGWGEIEDMLKQAYNMLSPDGKVAITNFTKEQMFEQLKRIGTIDWQSTYGRNLLSLIKARGSNGADILKYILGVPTNVEFGGFTSSLLFKEGAERQTRYLKQAYDIELDRIGGQFRRGLENGFTKEQLEEVASKTRFTDVIEGGQVNPKYFEKDGDKYILNSDGANYLKLQVTDYTDAMRKADAIRAQSEGTKEFLDETFSKIATSKGITPDVVDRLASSGAYQKMVDEFSRVVC